MISMIPMHKHLSLCGLAACFLISCDDDSENAPFVIYTVSGTLTAGSNLSGTGTGTFIYTVNDALGNTDGSAQLMGDVFSLRGRVSGGQVNLQFQEGKKYSNGNILGSESSSGFSGTFWLSDASGAQVKGTAEGTRSGASSGTGSGSGGAPSGCSSLVGKWVSADTFHSWEFTDSTAIIKTKSTDMTGALQISYLKYTNNGSSIIYYITRAAMTGSGGMDYDNVVNPAKGPYTENYSLSNCQLSIGGKIYKKS
jgi:hypothetical protein